jgi:hypothetical protein
MISQGIIFSKKIKAIFNNINLDISREIMIASKQVTALSNFYSYTFLNILKVGLMPKSASETASLA